MNLDSYNSQELRELKAEIDREIQKRRREEIREAQKELRTVAERYGFSLSELVASQGATPGTSRGIPKFGHPEDPGKTWSGRGRKPGWIKEWEEQGRSLDELLLG
jgi:DNA-binding protein H-NS